ncbi:MAG: c-type cytochrome [Arenicellales bacterium]|jgi:cytochrome c oxidase cbb3-type subunit 3
MFRFFIAIFIFVVIAVQSQAHAKHDGEHIYLQNCVSCHGYDGNGGMGIPLSLPDFLATASNDYLVKTIRVGRPGRVMPAFKNLSDNEVDMLIGYIRSWSDSIPPKYSKKPVKGDAIHGKQVYLDHCAECHGASGNGGKGTGVTMSRPRSQPILAPALNNRGFLVSASDEMIKNTLIKGRKGTPMKSYLKEGLSEQDINDVVAYVRSFEDRAAAIEETPEDEPAVIIKESPYSVEETVTNLTNAVGSMNFRLIRIQNLDSGLTEESKEDKKQVIVYSCNFNILNEALKLDPRVGLFLPCRITVSQQGDKVLVMYANPKRMNEIYNNSELDSMCTEMKTVYEDMIDEALL